MTSAEDIYRLRASSFGSEARRLQKIANRLSLARLAAFAGGLVLFAILLAFSAITAFITLAAALFLFAYFVIRFGNAERERKRNEYLEAINILELKSLQGDFSGYRSGAEYSDREHPYAYDLDIYGQSSLFQFICRTTSKPASDLLAGWLSRPASRDEIARRQVAVAELAPLTDWRQELFTLGYINSDSDSDPGPLMNWLTGEDLFPRRRREMAAVAILTILALTSVALVIAGLPPALLSPSFIINSMYFFTRLKRINRLHEKVSRSSGLLTAYSESVRLIERETFHAPILKDLQERFNCSPGASFLVRKLSRLTARLDSRLNVLISVPLNLLFFTDIHFCLALEKWKHDHGKKIPGWFEAMAEFETLASIANMSFNNPRWVFPSVSDKYFELQAEGMGHPLIPSGRRVCNDFAVRGSNRAVVITGSNMSGKSTFLRTCGVNTVLALAGAPVCALKFTVSHVKVHTSMRISDSLEENISSFYAELKRLRQIITRSEQEHDVFLLLDEILRGTNSDDRHTGSVALIRQLNGYGAATLVATHDLRLAGLEKELPGRLENYHFDVKVSGEELFFDYKLTPGICTSFNASLLMKKMGISI